MTTLTLDILNPKTLDQRKAVMQLVAFMIRKVRIAFTNECTCPDGFVVPLATFDSVPQPPETDGGRCEVSRS